MNTSPQPIRTFAPPYHEIVSVDIARRDAVKLDNGVTLHTLNVGEQDILRVCLLFRAGNLYQQAPLEAFAAGSMLPEGSCSRTAAEISETFDFYGATLNCSVQKDIANIQLTALRKHLPEVLPLLAEIVQMPSYPEAELKLFTERQAQKFMVDDRKNRSVALKHLMNALFGDEHPYGYLLQPEDFNRLSREQLLEFHHSHYHTGNCTVIAAGKVTDEECRLINRYFGTKQWLNVGKVDVPAHPIRQTEPCLRRIEREGSVQCAIRIGQKTCNRTHPDFPGLTFVCALLGGYFGSRLMSNIREDKGYTYGIYSPLVSLQQSGYFSIAAETGIDVTEAALKEAYFELQRLINEPTGNEELQIVRTFLMGELLRSFDGPFAQADSLLTLLEYEQDDDYYRRYMNCIKTIDAQEVQRIASQYMAPERMCEIVVG